jgi:hypothetical protein
VPSYADVVMWVWSLALLATLVGIAMAWRALARADDALVAVRAADPSDALTEGSRALAGDVERTADLRRGLHGRLDDHLS